MDLPLPLTRDVVFVGGGHTHALVLRAWGMRPLPGVRLTLINPDPTAAYSGMLPGFVAGHYTRDALDIDLVRLARFAGARLVLGAATGLDIENRQVHVPGRPPLPYDLCALDIGVTSDMPDLPGFADHGVPAKPLGPFAGRWAEYLAGHGPADVVVLGAGVAGAELALAMAHALQQAGRAAQVHLIDRSAALTAVDPRAAARLRAALSRLGVTLREHCQVVRVAADGLHLDDGSHIPASFVTGAAGARAQGWLGSSGLTLETGYVAVNDHLQSSDPAVFATGDCAHLAFDPRPKAGVYAVRQAPVLLHNLRAALTGTAMRRYRPQRDYLKLVSLGGRSALAQRQGLSLSGAMMWRWKDRIDQRFMQQFRDLPVMRPAPLPTPRAPGMQDALGDKPLCGGCGSKVGRGPLRAALASLPRDGRDDLRHLPGDDAALLVMGDTRQVLTTDHLRAFVEDPVLMTRIAIHHALGDIWAMGATPQAVTLSLILPPLAADLQSRSLTEVIETVADTLRPLGAQIVGGHTTVGAEWTIGISATGLCDHPPVTLAGGQPGDVLILTKPLGSGVLMAAEMARRARGQDVAAALDWMTRGQAQASEILSPRARAMTDVTGFGLAGHLGGICDASGVGARIDLAAVPLMSGALDLSRAGIRSSIFAENRSLAPEVQTGDKADLLFDPQTSGGLLAAVPPATADPLLEQMRRAGCFAAPIGALTDGPPRISLE